MQYSRTLVKGIRALFALNAVLFVAAPIVLLLKPADAFDEGPVMCPSRIYYGVECAGCGLTRATMHLLHGDWLEAYYYNGLVFVTTPILALIWIVGLWKSLQLSGLLPERHTIKLNA